MELLTLLLIGAVIVLLLQQKSFVNNKIERLEDSIFKLQQLIKTYELRRENEPKIPTKPVEKPSVQAEPAIPVKPPVPVIEKARPESVQDKQAIPENRTKPVIQKYNQPHIIKPPTIEPQPSFFERHPDLEKFIGENLVNKIGIAILVLSIGYFVKYAIDSNWIGEAGRVAIGILCGGILIAFAHKMRNSYTAFSSVLVGGGLAVFYFTITLAFHQFHLFSQITAFIILIVITLFAVALSLLYNKQELAIISLVGGFVSPFMISTGSANYNGLFLYLLILNIGLLIIAYYKSWQILNITAFGLTVVVFSGVLFRLTAATYYLGFTYGSIFYLLFFAINIAYNVRENKRFISSDFSILLINTALYFSLGLYLLAEMNLEQYRGLFSASLGFVNLCLSYVLFRNKKVDANVLYLLIGITLTFISLTAPIQLKGNHITLFWASEAVVLYWLYLKSQIKLTKLTAMVIWLAMLISLMMDWAAIYSSNLVYNVLANKGFITPMFAAAATYILSMLVKRDEQKDENVFSVPKGVLPIIATVLLFAAGMFEINHQFSTRYSVKYLNIIYLMLYLTTSVLLLNWLSNKLKSLSLSLEFKTVLIAATIILYVISFPAFFNLQRNILETSVTSSNHFIAYWVSAVFISILFYQFILFCRDKFSENILANVTWVVCAAIVLFLSLEVGLISNVIFFSKESPIDEIQRIYIKTGLPVLWGLSSFVMMWLGMKYKDRTLRIISLSLFSLTLLKLFLFDIRNIPPAGKIIAFFCLGILLLIVSFMYQKVKKIIIPDEEQPTI